MTQKPTISFSSGTAPSKGTVVLLVAEKSAMPPLPDSIKAEVVERAVKAADFKGDFGKTLQIHTPAETDLDRLVLLGLGDMTKLDQQKWMRLGGTLAGLANGRSKTAVQVAVPEGGEAGAAEASLMATGCVLGSYRFDRYKTKKDDKKKGPAPKIAFHLKSAQTARKRWTADEGVADGVMLARDLVNEPPNVLTPVEFATRASALRKLGCKVEILDEKAMSKLKMKALLGVAQGSRNAPRMAIIEWKGGKAKDKPVAFVGKGVTFDTGGISLKPGAGMGDMKGDMGGAAAVTGVMHALAARKAKVNAVGIIALVENMPDGNAQRPGDIVTSMSGQTIEILNTDAEGRLVLADALWHCNKKFKPQIMIDLATLTGAILIALGNHHAGMFSNDDNLAEQLSNAGNETGEKVWRMPLADAYDKLIDTPNADMKNIGGRNAGSITAAQFLKRFVGETPWAHLDVAGTAMDSPKTEISKSWASGYGVRLLDRLVADNYES